jgi:hypothetical protein
MMVCGDTNHEEGRSINEELNFNRREHEETQSSFKRLELTEMK